jgi:hypothetical protein
LKISLWTISREGRKNKHVENQQLAFWVVYSLLFTGTRTTQGTSLSHLSSPRESHSFTDVWVKVAWKWESQGLTNLTPLEVTQPITLLIVRQPLLSCRTGYNFPLQANPLFLFQRFLKVFALLSTGLGILKYLFYYFFRGNGAGYSIYSKCHIKILNFLDPKVILMTDFIHTHTHTHTHTHLCVLSAVHSLSRLMRANIYITKNEIPTCVSFSFALKSVLASFDCLTELSSFLSGLLNSITSN